MPIHWSSFYWVFSKKQGGVGLVTYSFMILGGSKLAAPIIHI